MFGNPHLMQPTHFTMDPLAVGLPMVREVAEIYFTQNTFGFALERGDLASTMTDDPFGLGFPPRDYIRSLHLTTSFRPLDQYRGVTEEEVLTLFYEQLKSLTLITRKDRLCVNVLLDTHFSDNDTKHERMMLNILEVLRQPIYDLMHAGTKLDLTHHN